MDPVQQRWQRLAHGISVRLRAGSIFQSSIPAAAFLGFVLLGLGLGGRWYGWERTWTLPAGAALLGGLALGFAMLSALRLNRESIEAGYARLDSTLGLNNALSSAAAGRGKWPPLPPAADDLLRFKWRRIIPAYLFCVLLAAAGLLIPLPAEVLAGRKIPPPRSHEEIVALISELEKANFLNPDDLKKLEQQLDEIRSLPAEEWYSHSSLEAADHLETGILEQLRSLESGMNKAGSSLASLEKADESTTSADRQRLAGEFKAAMQDLKIASPGLNQKLMEALSAIDPSSLKSLSSGDLGKMMEQMKDAAEDCRNCAGKCRGGTNGGRGDAWGELDEMLGGGELPGGGQQEGAGRGGIQRGPGVAALPLSRNASDLSTDKPESIQSEDFSRARPGDAIGTADTTHELDKSPVGPLSGGSASAGLGGEAVSRDALIPSEKAILKSYFR